MEDCHCKQRWGINVKDQVRDDSASDCSGLAMTGGYFKPHQPGSAQAFSIAGDPCKDKMEILRKYF